MSRKPTSISMEEEELINLKMDAQSEGMTVTQYLKKLARERKGSKLNTQEIKEEDMVQETESKGKESSEETFRRLRNEEKLHEKIDKLYDKQCEDGKCIQELKTEVQSMKPDAECPSCNNKTMFKGRKKQYCSNCGDGPYDWND